MAESAPRRKVETTSDLRAALVALAAGTTLTLVILLTAHAALPHSAVELPVASRNVARSLLPQGWGFFTRSPRDGLPVPYRVGRDGQWEVASLNARSNYVGGFGRRSRAQNIEMGLLVSSSGSELTPCDDKASTCLNATAPAATITNPSPSPLVCGDVGFIAREPVPWAWSHSAETVQMPAKILRLNVTC